MIRKVLRSFVLVVALLVLSVAAFGTNSVKAASCSINSFTINPTSATAGTVFNLSGSGSCSGGVRAIRFKIDGGIIYELGAPSATATWNSSGASAGTHTATVEVAGWDDNNWTQAASSSINFQVGAPNISCSADTISVSPGSATVGTTFSISGSGACNVGVRAIRFKVDGNIIYELGAPSATATWNSSGTWTGTHTATVEVAGWGDNDWSKAASKSTNFSVTGTPTITCNVDSATVSPTSGAAGTVFNISGSGSCSTGVRAIRFKVDGNIIYELGAPSATATWNSSGAADGTHTAMVEVAGQGDNDWSKAASKSVTFQVGSGSGSGGGDGGGGSPTWWYGNSGALNLTGYCQYKGYVDAVLVANDAYGWRCRSSSNELVSLDLYDTCRWQYGGGTPVYSNFSDPASWTCQGVGGGGGGNPSPGTYYLKSTVFGLNVRSSPGKLYTSIGQISPGPSYQMTGKNGNSLWLQIVYNGQKGWVCGQYTNAKASDIAAVPVVDNTYADCNGGTSGGPSNPPGDQPTPTPPKPKLRTTWVTNVRSGPNPTSSVIGKTVPFVQYDMLGRNNNNFWVKIDFKGTPGWICRPLTNADEATVSQLTLADNSNYDCTGNIVEPGWYQSIEWAAPQSGRPQFTLTYVGFVAGCKPAEPNNQDYKFKINVNASYSPDSYKFYSTDSKVSSALATDTIFGVFGGTSPYLCIGWRDINLGGFGGTSGIVQKLKVWIAP